MVETPVLLENTAQKQRKGGKLEPASSIGSFLFVSTGYSRCCNQEHQEAPVYICVLCVPVSYDSNMV